MRTEYRPETCPDCGAERERQWTLSTVATGKTQPGGGSWKTVAKPTRWVTACDCDGYDY
jgi:hypothetical protein